MRHLVKWSFLCLLVGVFGLTAIALPDVGDDLILTVTPDVPLKGGETVSFLLSDGTPGDIAFLFLGQQLGQYPIGELILDLIPEAFLPLGFFPLDGEIAIDALLPTTLPPELSGLIFHMQAISVGFDFGGGQPTLIWRKSNLDSIEFE